MGTHQRSRTPQGDESFLLPDAGLRAFEQIRDLLDFVTVTRNDQMDMLGKDRGQAQIV